MKRSRIRALVNLPLRDGRDQNLITSSSNAENEPEIKQEIMDFKEETIFCESLDYKFPKAEFLDESDVTAIVQVEDQPFNSNVKIEEDFVTLEDTSSNEDEDETYHPNKKIEINGSSHSGSKRSRRCRKTVEEPTVDKPTTMFDLIYERVPKSIKAKRNIGDSKKRKGQRKSSTLKRNLRDREIEIEEIIKDSTDCVSETDSIYKTAPNYRNRLDLDSAGRKLDSESTVNDQGQILNKNKSLRSYYCTSKNSKIWSDEETKNFYKALSVYGSDFSLMRLAFPNRSVGELKTKFKKEDKLCPNLVEDAVYKKFCSEKKIVETIANRPSDYRYKKRLKATDETSQKPIKELKDVWLELTETGVTPNSFDMLVKDSDTSQKSLDDNNKELTNSLVEDLDSQEIKSENDAEIVDVPKEETPNKIINELYLPEPKPIADKDEDMRVNIKFVEKDPLDLTDVIQLS